MTTKMSVGSQLKNMRKGRGLTLREFCSAHGFDCTVLSRIERGRLSASLDVELIRDVLVSLGVDQESDEYETIIRKSEDHQDVPPPLTDEELQQKLPLLCRLQQGEQLTDQKFHALANHLRRS